MKAILLKAAQIVNTLYSHRDKRIAVKNGETYDTPQFLTLPAGHEVDDPECWRLCVTGDMAPADDECRTKVLNFLGSPGRQALLQKIRTLRAAHGVQRLAERDLKWLEYMETAYRSELLPDRAAAPAATPAVKPVKPVEATS